MVGVTGLAVAQLLCRDAVVVRFPAGSGWSVQALLDRRASLDRSVLEKKLSRKQFRLPHSVSTVKWSPLSFTLFRTSMN